jgi:tRNA U38,U39,U40 pseudouridine synthase TruA
MVGVLAACGSGTVPAPEAASWLADPDLAGGEPARLTAPAAGLFLERVFYEGDTWPEPLRPPVAVR